MVSGLLFPLIIKVLKTGLDMLNLPELIRNSPKGQESLCEHQFKQFPMS